ncbi:glycine-rich domain-containing protein [Deinococcus aquaticus]|uniref:glycine-rich domain-containing protein n=1 Tax=Deinococcus aquaticus TaxID=328692 RepID=UPI003F4636F4
MTGTARTFPLSGQETVSPTAALTHYEFPPAMLRRAAQEHGWGHAFTECVAHEYRRFLILAATAGHPVTPSRAVDALWHEHLTFTRDYWERLTPLLPAPLHHEPATGEASDTDFAAQYRRTLDSYARIFGEVAPVDLWPDPTVRAAAPPPTATRTAGGVRVSALLLAALAGGVAFLTFLSTRFGVLAALGVFVLALILLTTAQANPAGTGARRDRRDGDGGGMDIGGSDGGGSDGGSSCGSSCGGGCSS